MKKQNEYTEIFRVKLNQLMKENEGTQEILAICVGVKRQAISNYQRGKTMPSADILAKIADFFNVSTDYLLGRNERYNMFFRNQIKTLKNTLRVIEDEIDKEVKSIDENKEELK